MWCPFSVGVQLQHATSLAVDAEHPNSLHHHFKQLVHITSRAEQFDGCEDTVFCFRFQLTQKCQKKKIVCSASHLFNQEDERLLEDL